MTHVVLITMTGKLSIAQMRSKCTDHFFSSSTKRFFKGRSLKAYYSNGQNYIRMMGDRDSWYTFSASGKTNYITVDKVPLAIKKKVYPHKY